MKMPKVLFVVMVIIALMMSIFYVYSLVHVHSTCDGHVVKNVFDWPVCVH